MTPDERAVLTANDVFYSAFAGQDADAMEAIWARNAEVGCVHPGWAPLRDRPTILGAWRAIFDGPSPPAVTAEDARATVVGGLAWVLCIERLESHDGSRVGVMSATNVFVREDGEWRIAHHHAGPIARPDEDDDEDDDEDGGGALLN